MFTNAETILQEHQYPNNEKKEFIDAVSYLETELPENEYTEFKNATLNVREKILFKDLKDTVESKMKKYSNVNIYSQNYPNVEPNRQIYFFTTVLDSQKQIDVKYILVDAETKDILFKGTEFTLKRGKSW